MEERIKLQGLSFSYANGVNAISNLDLEIKAGESLLISGPSGAGKTTLARCLNGLIPSFYGGELRGHISVFGRNPQRIGPRGMSKLVAILPQSCEDFFIFPQVSDELSGGVQKSSGKGRELSPLKDREISEGIIKKLDLENLLDRSISTLSGGETRRVAIASILLQNPRLLVMDEPFVELDTETLEKVVSLLKEVNKRGTTLLIIEHRPVDSDLVKREVEINHSLLYDGKPRRKEEKVCIEAQTGPVLLRIRDLYFSYDDHYIFDGFSEEFRSGEFVLLDGRNGSGKTTLLRIIMGLLRPEAGEVETLGNQNPNVWELAGRVGYVFQNPEKQIFADTVEEEVVYVLKNTSKMGRRERAERTMQVLREFSISKYRGVYPRYLSGGEQQRVALASVLISKPRILLLDEPTRGMDNNLKKMLAHYLANYVKQGNLVIMATHDPFLSSLATRTIRLKSNGC